ncbi:hypothetical protein LCGC14_1284510 [marine sediment metagenome]|uniref:AP2/ERF domain-containing protein n=1 Tax=marine sediment metagenome TaxID=412755 RepID=A0A0F9KU83_9ZZZZ|nr:hypothetical protein [Pricia sp.]
MKRIPLTQGQFALVDDEDYEELSKHKWCLRQKGDGLFYAGRNNWHDKKSHSITIHQQLMNLPENHEIDHRDGNGLDNRRSNLRVCTHRQNLQNQKRQKNNKCGFKGVHWNNSSKKWRAKIFVNGKNIHLGVFFCLIQAAKAYNKAAVRYFGEFARVNNVQ